jgi:hypothetical protein
MLTLFVSAISALNFGNLGNFGKEGAGCGYRTWGGMKHEDMKT